MSKIESAIIALGIIGDPSAVNLVSEYLYSNSRKIVVAAINSLGAIATPSAILKLGDRLGGDSELDLLNIDIVSKTQIPEALEMLNQNLRADSSLFNAESLTSRRCSSIVTPF